MAMEQTIASVSFDVDVGVTTKNFEQGIKDALAGIANNKYEVALSVNSQEFLNQLKPITDAIDKIKKTRLVLGMDTTALSSITQISQKLDGVIQAMSKIGTVAGNAGANTNSLLANLPASAEKSTAALEKTSDIVKELGQATSQVSGASLSQLQTALDNILTSVQSIVSLLKSGVNVNSINTVTKQVQKTSKAAKEAQTAVEGVSQAVDKVTTKKSSGKKSGAAKAVKDVAEEAEAAQEQIDALSAKFNTMVASTSAGNLGPEQNTGLRALFIADQQTRDEYEAMIKDWEENYATLIASIHSYDKLMNPEVEEGEEPEPVDPQKQLTAMQAVITAYNDTQRALTALNKVANTYVSDTKNEAKVITQAMNDAEKAAKEAQKVADAAKKTTEEAESNARAIGTTSFDKSNTITAYLESDARGAAAMGEAYQAAYDAAQSALKQYNEISANANATEEEKLQAAENLNKAYDKLVKRYNELSNAANRYKQATSTQNSQAGQRAIQKASGAGTILESGMYDINTTQQNYFDKSKTEAAKQMLQAYTTALENARAAKIAFDQAQKSGDVSKQVDSANKLNGAMNTLDALYKRLTVDANTFARNEKLQQRIATNVESIKSMYEPSMDAINNNEALSKSFEKLCDPTKWTSFGQWRDALKAFNQQAEASGIKITNVFDKIKMAFTEGSLIATLKGVVIRKAFQMIMSSIRTLYQEASELNAKLAEFQVVSGKTADAMTEMADKFIDAAKEVSSSVEDIIEASTTFSRLGFSDEESLELAKLTTMYAAVGNVDVEDAESHITSIIKAYGVGVDALEGYLDKLILVGNNYAISSSELGEGLANAGSLLQSNGNTLEESIALLLGANNSIQDISKASTGLRTISARLTNATTELEELGEDTDNLATSTYAYRQEILALTNNAVDITTDDGSIKSTFDILGELSDVWDSLKSDAQDSLKTLIAGNRQQNVLVSLLQSWEEIEEALATMEGSNNELSESYEVVEETTESYKQRLSDVVTELGAAVFQTDGVNNALQVLTDFLEALIPLAEVLGGALEGLADILGILSPFLKIVRELEDVTFGPLIDSLTGFLDLMPSTRDASNGLVTMAQNLENMDDEQPGVSYFNSLTNAVSLFIAALAGLGITGVAGAGTATTAAIGGTGIGSLIGSLGALMGSLGGYGGGAFLGGLLDYEPSDINYTADALEHLDERLRAFQNHDWIDYTKVGTDAVTKFENLVNNELNALWDELNNGNVEISMRPVIEAPTMQAAGWGDFTSGDYATLYTQGYTIGEGEYTYSIDVTPILPDGTVLTPQELDEYVNGLITDSDEALLASDSLGLLVNYQHGEWDDTYWNAYYEAIAAIKQEALDATLAVEALQQQQTKDSETGTNNGYIPTTMLQDRQTGSASSTVWHGITDEVTEQIDTYQSTINTLYEAWEKLASGEMEKSDLIDLIQEFPTLAEKVDTATGSVDGLGDAIIDLMSGDKEDVLEELNTALDDPTLTTEAREEIEALIVFIEGSFNDLDFSSVEEKVKSLGETIHDTIKEAMEDSIDGLSEVADEMETLAEIQSDVENSTKMTFSELLKYASVYPEILAAATTTADGQIQLDSDVATSFISARKAELQAQVNAKVSELEAQKASLEAQIQLKEAELQVVEAVEQGKLDAEEGELDAFLQANAQSVQNIVNAGASEAEAYAKVANSIATNMGNAAASSSTSMAAGVNSGISNITALNNAVANSCSNMITNMGKVGQAVADALAGTVYGGKVGSGSTSQMTNYLSKLMTSTADESTNQQTSSVDIAKGAVQQYREVLKYNLKNSVNALKASAADVGASIDALTNIDIDALVDGITSSISSSGGGGSSSTEKSAFEQLYEQYEHQVAIGEKTTAEFLKWLDSAYKAAYKEGTIDLDDYWKYEEEVYDGYQDLLEDAKDAFNDLVDEKQKLIEQDLENQKDSLEDQLDALEEFYDKQIDMLEDEHDEEEYIKNQTEKRKAVADLQAEMEQLSKDNSAWAEKRRLELQEELDEATEELNEFESDQAREDMKEFLETEYENQEKAIESQIQTIEDKLDDPQSLFNQALTAIKTSTDGLYDELLAYNRQYGSGNDEDIKEQWEEWRKALLAYATYKGSNYEGVSLKAYASGTSFASGGLHVVNEDGQELILSQPKSGNFAWLNSGDKVFNSSAAQFLYDFANAPIKAMANYLSSGSSKRTVTTDNSGASVVMGDIIINGNADKQTVSEIRRAQRESLRETLEGFKKLQK